MISGLPTPPADITFMFTVHFFPQGLPDETFSSRVARYHLMVGNRTSTATFNQLFGQFNFPLDQIVPPHLEALSARLPGEPGVTLHSLLANNTLLPLFQPFLGKRGGHGNEGGLINRLPRRVVGKHGEAHLCIQCLVEARERFGFGYWHRSHQAPSVTACWKHGTLLLNSCPVCNLPFQRKNKLLDVPWHPCSQCDYELGRDSPAHAASKNEVGYAIFVHDLLNANIAPVPPDLLIQVYRQRIQEIGFIREKRAKGKSGSAATARNSVTSITAFTEDLIETFGHDFIALIDPAYAAGRTTFWIRFAVIDGTMDLPLTRHVLLAMRLFGTAAKFLQAITSVKYEAPSRSQPKLLDASKADVELRNQHRQRILREIRIEPAITLEGLWRKAYRPTAWLFEHDKKWLTTALTSGSHDGAKQQEATAEELLRDQAFAEKAETYARKLVGQNEKPSRITKQKLLDHLPLNYSFLNAYPHKFPRLSESITLCQESSWSLSARRILWAIGEVQNLGMTLTPASIVARTSVSYYVFHKVCQFAQWDLEVLARQPINIPSELARAGIGLTWQGPKSIAWAEVGGRAYVATTTRISNKGDSLLLYTEGIQPPSLEQPNVPPQS